MIAVPPRLSSRPPVPPAKTNSRPTLGRGDLLPLLVTPPPGARSRALSRQLAQLEAPGINTLVAGRPTLVWQAARGANVLDADGNRFLDLTSGFGVAAVGHRHPRVVAAVRRQAGSLLHGLGDAAAHPQRIALAARLCRLAPVVDPQVYFAISGSDAIEIALKTALLATGKPGIVAFTGAYHGVTLGSLAATSRTEFRAPFLSRMRPHVLRLPFGADPELLAGRIAGRKNLGAVLVEPVLGREGVVFPPAGWLRSLAALCRTSGLLLIVDEVFTGFGRTGVLFACEREDVRPDLLCVGKALGGGLPIAAVLGRRELFAAWQTPGEALHTATFVAHPLACAAALAVLDVLESERLVPRAAAAGARFARRLAIANRPVRGAGLLWGVEYPTRESAAAAVAEALAAGVLLLAGGPDGKVLQIAPPLTITNRQLDYAADVLSRLA